MRIVIFGGSFNPPAMNHKIIVEKLSEKFDRVIVVPCGMRRNKPEMAVISQKQRKEMAILAFQGMPKVELDFYDIDNNVFTPTYLLQKKYQKFFPESEIWLAIGNDLLAEIKKTWIRGKEIWRNLKFVVVAQPNKTLNPADLPQSSEVLEIKKIPCRSTTVRKRISDEKPIGDLIPARVAEYIFKHGLYK